MELDINTDWVSAYTYVAIPQRPEQPAIGLKLGGDMSRGGDRYFQAGERDFFAFLAEPEAPPVTALPTSRDRPAPRPPFLAATARYRTGVSYGRMYAVC